MDFYMFLAEELDSVFDEIENKSRCAHEICVCLSIRGTNMPETIYRMYTDHIFRDNKSILNSALAYFTGAGFMNVICDCESFDRGDCTIFNLGLSPYFQMGLDDCLNQTEMYKAVQEDIQSFHNMIFSN